MAIDPRHGEKLAALGLMVLLLLAAALFASDPTPAHYDHFSCVRYFALKDVWGAYSGDFMFLQCDMGTVYEDT